MSRPEFLHTISRSWVVRRFSAPGVLNKLGIEYHLTIYGDLVKIVDYFAGMTIDKVLSVLIVEDDPIIAYDISIILNKKGYTIAGLAHNATKAIDVLSKHEIDIAILDIHLGTGQNGIDIAKVIHTQYDMPYIFLTSFSDEFTLNAAREQGPYGYLVKPFQEATLLSTLSIAWSNHQMKKDRLNLDRPNLNLTDQEKLLCEGFYKGMSYQEIADEMHISINTVRYHVKNLYLKFDVNGRAEMVAKMLHR